MCNVLYLAETQRMRVRQNSVLQDLHSLGATSFVRCPTAGDGRPPATPQGPDVIVVGLLLLHLRQPEMGGGGQSLRLFKFGLTSLDIFHLLLPPASMPLSDSLSFSASRFLRNSTKMLGLGENSFRIFSRKGGIFVFPLFLFFFLHFIELYSLIFCL